MTITRVGSATATTTSLTLPTGRAVGDLEVMIAARNSATLPTVPSGWTTIVSNTSNSYSILAAYRYCTSTSDTSGTWTSATDLVCVVYRNAEIGASATSSATTSTSISYPALTLQRTNGTSWVLGAGYSSATSVTVNAPTGMTNITSAGTGPRLAVHDTNAAVSAWSATNGTTTVSGTVKGLTLEILDASLALSVSESPDVAAFTNIQPPSGCDLEFASGTYSLAGTSYGSLSALPGISLSTPAAYAYNSDGSLTSVSANVGRVGTAGLLVEQSSTNLILWSYFGGGGAHWTGYYTTTYDGSATAPDGTANGTAIIDTTVTNPPRGIYANDEFNVNANDVYTGSIYVKAGSVGFANPYIGDDAGTAYWGTCVDLNGGTQITYDTSSSSSAYITGNSLQAASGGWYRSNFTGYFPAAELLDAGVAVSTVSNAGIGNSYSGAGNNAAYFWGYQIEKLGFSTSPIIDSGATGTRNVDSVALAMVPPSGAFHIDLGFTATRAVGQTRTLLDWNDGSDNNKILIQMNASNQLVLTVINGGTSHTIATESGSPAAARSATATAAWDGSSTWSLTVSGTAIGSATTATVPAVTSAQLGNTRTLSAAMNDPLTKLVVTADSGGSGVSGTLSSTEAPDTAALAGGPVIGGGLASTEASDTAALAGGIYGTGALSSTEAADTAAAAGAVGSAGTLAATEAADTAALTGGIKGTAALAATEAADAATLTGMGNAFGPLAATETADTASLAGGTAASVQAALAASEASDTAAMAGGIFTTAGLATLEAADQAAAAGNVFWASVLAASEAADVANLAVTARDNAVLAASEAVDTAAGAGQVAWLTSLAVTENPDVSALAGVVIVTGALAASEAPDQADIIGAGAAISAAIAATEAPDVSTASGNLNVFGPLASTEAPDVSTAAGMIGLVGAMSATEAVDVAVMAAAGIAQGVVAATEAPDLASVVGHLVTNGQLAASEAPDQAALSALTSALARLAAGELPDVARILGRARSTRLRRMAFTVTHLGR